MTTTNIAVVTMVCEYRCARSGSLRRLNDPANGILIPYQLSRANLASSQRPARLAKARRGAEPGLASRASDRKERLGASGLTRTLCPAAPRRRLSGARAGAAL